MKRKKLTISSGINDDNNKKLKKRRKKTFYGDSYPSWQQRSLKAII